jgi:small subunit ribosomal protein S1
MDPQLRSQLAVGAEIPVYVVNPEDSEGRTIVSITRGLVQTDWDRAQALLESQEIWEGRISGYNRGGLLVDFGRLRGFIPTSHLAGFPRSIPAEERNRRLAEMVGRQLGLRVIEVDQQRNRLVLSERAAYREWREQQQERVLEELREDQVVRGRVSSIQDFGVFVDLQGVEGLIHVSELSWSHVEDPHTMLKVGDEVEVRVIRVDRERKRVSLSLRQTGGDPWERIEERYTLGQLIDGRVTRIVSYGAFIEVEPGVEGLVHISELGEEKVGNPRDVLEEGEVLPLRVIRIDATRRRLGLSFKRVTPEEYEEWRARRLHTREVPVMDRSRETGKAEEAPEVEEPSEEA